MKTVARLQPMVMPMWLMLALSVVLTITAAALYAGSPPNTTEAPTLASFREPDGRVFTHERLKQSPYVYGLGHALPAVVWCFAIPFQHVKQYRARYPTAHRWLGRLTIALSLLLSITGMAFTPLKLAYSHPSDMFHVHRLRVGRGAQPVTVLAWPTFDMFNMFLGPMFFWSAVQTIRYARAKDYATHKRWAWWCTALGYMPPIQRVWMGVSLALSVPLAWAPKQVHAFLRHASHNTLAQTSEIEVAAFALTVWAACVTVFVVAFYQTIASSSSSSSSSSQRRTAATDSKVK